MSAWENQSFTIAHADNGTFKGAGVHRDMRHCDAMELIEVTSSADFTTQEDGAE